MASGTLGLPLSLFVIVQTYKRISIRTPLSHLY